MASIATEFGPSAFKNQMPALIDYINKFLKKETYCQGGSAEVEGDEEVEDDDDDDEEEEDEDEDIDHDEIILGNVVDLINELSRIYGDFFVEAFNAMAPNIVEYTKDTHPKNDRNAALGCFAETFCNSPALIPQYFNDYWILVTSMAGNDSKINRNVAYATGVLA